MKNQFLSFAFEKERDRRFYAEFGKETEDEKFKLLSQNIIRE